MPYKRVVRKVRSLVGSGPEASTTQLPTSTPASKPTAESPLEEPRRLVEAGRHDEAIEVLRRLNVRSQSLQVEHRIVNARWQGAVALPHNELPAVWPPTYDDPFPDVVGQTPEVDALELTTEIMGGAIVNHGALIVRGLLDDDTCTHTRAAIDQAHTDREAYDRFKKNTRWFCPLIVPGRNDDNGVMRGQVAGQGGVWLNDSPASSEMILARIHETPVVECIGEYLGERPVLSLQKSTLRRSSPEFRIVSWHQDGAFLDPGIRTVNVWVALTACGGDLPSPGLELAPRRFDDIIPPDGGELAANSLSGWAVFEALDGMPTITPEFQPGDAIIFDERFVHRTHLTEDMTEPRYALENWFFAPSSSVGGYDMLLP